MAKQTMTDGALLTEYVRDGSQPAFAELVRRYMDLVHSAALRQVCDSHLAKDVTQQVFICLAQKAGTLNRVPSIVGWVHRATRLEALKLLRERTRRRQREARAVADMDSETGESTPHWAAVAPLIDEALNRLSAKDRDAVLMRYFESKSLRHVAGALGVSEDAAQKRVSRALENLRQLLARSGATVPATGLGALLSANAVQTAPAGLAAVVANSVAAGVAQCGAGVFPTFLKAMAISKFKVAVVACAAVTAVTIPFVFTESGGSPRVPTERKEKAIAEVASESATSDTSRATNSLEPEIRVARSEAATNDLSAPNELKADSLEAIRKRALDPANSPKDRLAALSSLRDLNARDGEVVVAMLALASQDGDPAVRADVFRQLNGVTDGALKNPLVTALNSDETAGVRAEAAETLAAFRDDPTVKELLQKAARGDANHEVRIAASESLSRGQPAGVLSGVLADSRSSDVERYGAAMELRKIAGPTTEQAKVLVEILRSSSIGKLREEAVEDLGRHYGNVSGVVEWMQHLAATDPNSKVQEEASEFLEKKRAR